MKRLAAVCVFSVTFPLLVALAGLVALLRGAGSAIAWLSDLATPLVLRMAEIADGTATHETIQFDGDDD